MEENKKEKKSFNIFKLGYKFIVSLAIVLVVLTVSIIVFCNKISENKKTYDNVITFEENMDTDIVVFNITGDYEEVTFEGDCGVKAAVKGGSNIYKITVKNASKKAISYTVTPKVVYEEEYGIPLYISVSAPKEEYLVGSPKEVVKYNEVEGLSFTETLKSEKEAVFYVTVKLLHSDTSNFNEDVDIDFVFDVETKINEEVNAGFTDTFRFVILLFIIWFILIIVVIIFILIHAFIQLNKALLGKKKDKPIEIEGVPSEEELEKEVPLVEEKKSRKKVKSKEKKFKKDKNKLKVKPFEHTGEETDNNNIE